MGLLQQVNQQALDQQLTKRDLKYRDDNSSWWRQRLRERFGIKLTEPVSSQEDDVGGSVRVDSPDYHYHQTGGNIPGWIKAAALLAGGAGLAAAGAGLYRWASLLRESNKTPVVQGDPKLNPGGLQIEVIKPK